VQPFTESDDNRYFLNAIFPPEDGHVNARNMSRIIVYKIENCALKLVNEIILKIYTVPRNIMVRCRTFKNSTTYLEFRSNR
jgi:hypothetical protein